MAPVGARRLALVSSLAASVLGACAGEAPSPADAGGADAGLGADASAGADAGAARDAGAVDPAAHVGTFTVQLHVPVVAAEGVDAREGFTSVSGRVSSGPTPAQLIWETQTATMGCVLMTPRAPFCASSCGASAACVADGVCQTYPTARSVGAVTMTGLANREGRAEVTLLVGANTYQTPTDVHLSYPAFAEGATVGLRAAGSAEVPAFAVEAPGILPLESPTSAVAIRDGAALELTWTPPTRPELSRIAVALDISHHGGTKGMITCDVADTGALTIPAPMVDALVALGVAGFPSVTLARRVTRAVTTEAGTIRLVIGSEVQRSVTIDGLTSCVDDEGCPTGETCGPDLSCR